MIEKGQI